MCHIACHFFTSSKDEGKNVRTSSSYVTNCSVAIFVQPLRSSRSCFQTKKRELFPPLGANQMIRRQAVALLPLTPLSSPPFSSNLRLLIQTLAVIIASLEIKVGSEVRDVLEFMVELVELAVCRT